MSIAREANDCAELSYALGELSIVETEAGNLQRAVDLLGESQPISQELGDEAQVVICRHNIACALREMGRVDEARHIMESLIADTLKQRSPIMTIVLAEDYAAVLAEAGTPPARHVSWVPPSLHVSGSAFRDLPIRRRSCGMPSWRRSRRFRRATGHGSTRAAARKP